MDVDMDMDLDLTVDASDEHFNNVQPEALTGEAGHDEVHTESKINPFDGSIVGAGDIAFEKVHIRGLDNLDNKQIKTYINTYFESPHFQRIEWIDDTSANLVYDSTSAASEALVAFTNTDVVDVSQLDTLVLRPARPMELRRSDGDIEIHELQLRQATTSDVKKRGAHDASKFYLMNPDKDPREQRFRERRDKIRNNVENGDYRRMRFDDHERKRRRDEDTFDESMYDEQPDDAGTHSADEERRKRVRFGRRNDRDLFAGREKGRLRDRSASPLRGADGDGRYGFGSDTDMIDRRRPIRQRSLTPPRRNNNANAGKELFASRTADLAPAAPLELFPAKAAAASGTLGSGTHSHSSSMELFPDKARRSHHRRSGAIDASPERFAVNNERGDRPRSLAERITGSSSSLADRITGRPASAGMGGSLADRVTPRASGGLADRITRDGAQDEGMSIRGNSGVSIKGRADAGEDFSIKGASGGGPGGVKELFPVKAGTAGNAGKELFGEKLKGRGLARRTAASYF